MMIVELLKRSCLVDDTLKEKGKIAKNLLRSCPNYSLSHKMALQGSFKQAVDLAKHAVEADRAEEYEKALNLYKKSITYFMHVCKYDKSKSKHIMPSVQGYMTRAEEIKKFLSEQTHEPTKIRRGSRGGGSIDGSATATKKKTKKTDSAEEESDLNIIQYDGQPVDLEGELSKIIGLEKVKADLRNFKHQLDLDMRRKELGFSIDKASKEHMCFMGSPGTGKTTIARLTARIMADVGLLEKGQFIEVQRSDLVEGFIGQTATKTKKVIEAARGGVLFVDEAYRLVPGGGSGSGSKDFGTEAINELMSAMNDDNAPVMIFAGYVDDMKRFFAANEGLTRRVSRQFIFEDMTVSQIAALTKIKIDHSPFCLAKDADDAFLEDAIEKGTSERQRGKLNGGLASLLLTGAKASLDRRLTLAETNVDNIMTYSREDVVNGVGRLPQPIDEDEKA